MDIIRVWLLRIILGWWIIPFGWIVLWTFIWLLDGDSEYATHECKDMARAFWFGDK